MRASDLLSSTVFAADAEKIGRVLDIEACPTGAKVSDAWGKALRVNALLVGPGAEFARLGYLRRQMAGPLGLRFLARRLPGYVVRWNQIGRISPGRIELNCPAEELERLRPPD